MNWIDSQSGVQNTIYTYSDDGCDPLQFLTGHQNQTFKNLRSCEIYKRIIYLTPLIVTHMDIIDIFTHLKSHLNFRKLRATIFKL